MVKMLLTFVCLFIIFYTGIELLQRLSGKERWNFVKNFTFSLVLALVVVVCMVGMVVLF